MAGAVIGALIFGWLTDRFGRRTVFYATLIVYLTGVLLTATSWNFLSFALFRAITGIGIGGEYAAINSAIDELIPARFRGRIDIIVNGSFWLGPPRAPAPLCCFSTRTSACARYRLALRVCQSGACWALALSCMRRYVPESPRWLVTHGFDEQADATIADIEQRVRADTGARTCRPRKD